MTEVGHSEINTKLTGKDLGKSIYTDVIHTQTSITKNNRGNDSLSQAGKNHAADFLENQKYKNYTLDEISQGLKEAYAYSKEVDEGAGKTAFRLIGSSIRARLEIKKFEKNKIVTNRLFRRKILSAAAGVVLGAGLRLLPGAQNQVQNQKPLTPNTTPPAKPPL